LQEVAASAGKDVNTKRVSVDEGKGEAGPMHHAWEARIK
jgi:hypothetical protein